MDNAQSNVVVGAGTFNNDNQELLDQPVLTSNSDEDGFKRLKTVPVFRYVQCRQIFIHFRILIISHKE